MGFRGANHVNYSDSGIFLGAGLALAVQPGPVSTVDSFPKRTLEESATCKKCCLVWRSAAAVIVPAVPAQAERWSEPGFVAAASVAVHRGSPNVFPRQWSDGGDRQRHDRRRHRRDRFDDTVFIGDIYREDNPAWDPEGYNDWWHERRSRNTPRWVHNNQNCERQYSTGAGWKC